MCAPCDGSGSRGADVVCVESVVCVAIARGVSVCITVVCIVVITVVCSR